MNVTSATSQRPRESLRGKLLRSHLSIAGIGLLVATAALFAIQTLGAASRELTNNIAPTAQASVRLLNGINSSTSALRGWVSLGDKQFRTERRDAWENEITPAQAELRILMKDSHSVTNLTAIFTIINDLKESQWWIEDVAQTPGNNRPKNNFNEIIKPLSSVILLSIAELLALEQNQTFSNKNNSLLNAFRYHFSEGVSSIERYLNNPEQQYLEAFERQLKQTIVACYALENALPTFTSTQQNLVTQISAEIVLFKSISQEIIRQRSKADWNVAEYRLKHEAVPLARELIEKLTLLSTHHENMMKEQSGQIESTIMFSIMAVTLLIAAMIISATLISSRNSQRITQPIIALNKAAKMFYKKQYIEDFVVKGNDEISDLSHTFNTMRQSIDSSRKSLEASKQQLEVRVKARTDELAVARDLAETTLLSIGDAVISTDMNEIVVMMNPIAEQLVGWSSNEAIGQKISDVFNVINEKTLETVACPIARCIESDTVILLESDTNLIRRDGTQVAIDDSAAPIHNAACEIVGAILVFRDITNERKLQQKLTYQASHDTLTGLVNRYEFELRTTNAFTFSQSEQRTHSIAFLDLDQFKIVNDTCGHAAGDELLRQLAKMLAGPIRNHDTLARLGGDEFAILLEDCDINNAVKVCDKIRQEIKNYRFVWDDQYFELGVSIGIAILDENCESVANALSNADSACYKAKESGRNCVKVFNEKGSNRQRNYMQWASRITEAIDENRLHLYIQPIISLTDNSNNASHCEVLVRLLDRDNNLILPGAFLPAAERYNLIHSIDCYVVSKACEAYSEKLFGDVPVDKHTISINLSGQSMGAKEVLTCIRSSMEKYLVPPEVLCFEITETAAMSNMSEALDFINELKSLGCRFALDDFGSGLSSYGYLQNIPVDFVKIDGRFVKDMVSNPIDAAMVKSINEIAHLMDKKTIAEFVENTEIADMLREMGVDYVQGWGFGNPVPIKEHLSALASLS